MSANYEKSLSFKGIQTHTNDILPTDHYAIVTSFSHGGGDEQRLKPITTSSPAIPVTDALLQERSSSQYTPDPPQFPFPSASPHAPLTAWQGPIPFGLCLLGPHLHVCTISTTSPLCLQSRRPLHGLQTPCSSL